MSQTGVSQFGAFRLRRPIRLGRWHFVLGRVHSLTGLVFGGFLIVHLLASATLFQGGNLYQAQVDRVHSLPFLGLIRITFVYLPILFHAGYGGWLAFAGRPNVREYPYVRNAFCLAQRISAGVIALFILFHVLAMRGFLGATLAFDPADATRTVARHMNASVFVAYLIYPLGIAASCYHLANGFWTAGITWGVTVSATAQRRWGVVCGALFAFTLICGFLALAAAVRDGSLLAQ